MDRQPRLSWRLLPGISTVMRRKRPGRASANARRSTQKPQADEPDDDQINRYDDVQEPRNDEDENAGDERDDGLEMIDAEGHGISPDIMRANNCGACCWFPKRIIAEGERNGQLSSESAGAEVCWANLRHTRFPSPLVGEGGSLRVKRATSRVRGRRVLSTATPHPVLAG